MAQNTNLDHFVCIMLLYARPWMQIWYK